jgi:predicted transcriptional regulator
MASGELSRFLFEIASEERLGILDALAKKPLKHAALARGLSITGSETTRHLNRLTSAGLVAKNARGEYELTTLAEGLRAGLPFLRFLVTHRQYLLSHVLDVLGAPFVARLGELSRGTFLAGTYEVVGAQETALRAVTRRIWVVTEQRFEQGLPILREKAARGVDVRVVRPRRLLEEEKRTGRDVQRNFPVKTLPQVSLFLAVLDDQAGLCLPTPDQRIDMATMILLTDPEGFRWSEELFLQLWNGADWWRPPSLGRPVG